MSPGFKHNNIDFQAQIHNVVNEFINSNSQNIMKTLSTTIALLASAGFSLAQTFSVNNPSDADGTVTIPAAPGFFQTAGNYSASSFNTDSNRLLIDFDDQQYTDGVGNLGSTIFFNDPEANYNFRANFSLILDEGSGFGRSVNTEAQFVSSTPNAIVWGNKATAVITFPEFITGSLVSEPIYGVGFTLSRLQIPVDVRLYSDVDGNSQIGSTITLSANNGGSGYSFFGYSGNTVIRRVEVDPNGLANSFGIDDLVVTTTQVPEPAEQSMMLGGLIAVFIFLVRRFRKNKV